MCSAITICYIHVSASSNLSDDNMNILYRVQFVFAHASSVNYRLHSEVEQFVMATKEGKRLVGILSTAPFKYMFVTYFLLADGIFFSKLLKNVQSCSVGSYKTMSPQQRWVGSLA